MTKQLNPCIFFLSLNLKVLIVEAGASFVSSVSRHSDIKLASLWTDC